MRWRLAVLGMVWAIAMAACSGGSGGSGPVANGRGPAETASAPEASTPDTTAPPCTVDTCALREAGARQDLRVGVAVKLGDPARLDLQAQEFDAASSEIEFL